MTDEALATLRVVLQETPTPPPPEADPYDVIGAAETMAKRRHKPVEALRAMLGESPWADGEGERLLLEIRERNARWAAALARARVGLADRRTALERLKRANRRRRR